MRAAVALVVTPPQAVELLEAIGAALRTDVGTSRARLLLCAAVALIDVAPHATRSAMLSTARALATRTSTNDANVGRALLVSLLGAGATRDATSSGVVVDDVLPSAPTAWAAWKLVILQRSNAAVFVFVCLVGCRS